MVAISNQANATSRLVGENKDLKKRLIYLLAIPSPEELMAMTSIEESNVIAIRLGMDVDYSSRLQKQQYIGWIKQEYPWNWEDEYRRR